MKFPNIVVGRERDLEALKMQFDILLEGRWALATIVGDTGIGKTTLVKRALADLSLANGTCIYGKFEQYNDDKPYLTIVQILEQIAGHMLTLPEDKLGRLRKELSQELGRDSALITWMVPKAQGILGKLRDIKVTDHQKLKIRLETAFQAFVTIAARELYPLVIAVDDLQWADQLSWQVLKSFYDPSSDHPLYLILVYKNDLEEYREKVTAMLGELAGNELIKEIKPETLSVQETSVMLAGAFDGDFDNFHELVQLAYRKTAGNPLYIQQMLNLFLENKGVYYAPEKKAWCLDREQAEAVSLPDSVADLISTKIDILSSGAKELLEIAACAGSSFTPVMFRAVTGYSFDYLEEHLGILCRLGLIVETGAGYEFFHNRIHQNAYEQIAPDRKEELHYRIATALLKQPDQNYIAENLLSITAHLLHCPRVIKREGAGAGLTLPLYRAGMMAKQSAAVEHALKLFSLAEELLGESPWQNDYHHTLRLKLELAECLFICGRYDAAERNFVEMLAQAACEQDRIAIKKRYMVLHSYAGAPDRVITLGLEALKYLDFSPNTQRLKLQVVKEILYGRFLFRDNRLEAIKNAPPVTNERLADILEILTLMAPSANLLDENFFRLIVLKIGNLSARYGNSPYAPLGYAAYSMVLGNVLGDYIKGEKLQNIALGLTEQFDEEQFAAVTYFCIGSYTAHWTAPARESFAYLQKAFQSALRSGDYLYSCYTLMIMLEMKHSMGVPLTELAELVELPEKYPRELSNDLLRRALDMFREHIHRLSMEGISPDRAVEEQENEELNTNEVMIYHLLKIQRLYLSGRLEETHLLLKKYIQNLDSIRGYINQVDGVFYYLLVSLEKMKKRKGSRFRFSHFALRRYRKKLRGWAELCPANHGAKHLLIEALYRELSNRPQDAFRLYERAIDEAQKGNNLFLQALGNYLAAACFRESPRLARVYAGEACRLFYQWGSPGTAHRIRRLYGINDAGGIFKSASLAGDSVPEHSRENPEVPFTDRLPDYQKNLETLELGPAYRYFLDVVCRETGADFGGILLERDDRLWLEYRWQKDGKAFKFRAAPDPEQVDFLPKRVLRYAGRTYETVVILAKPGEGPFAGDDYIKEKPGISIICLPLKYNDIFVGLVYLESSRNHRFDAVPVEKIRHLSFYLVTKEALARDTKSQASIEPKVPVQLTERELEVLRYMAEGLSNKEIGEKLYISSSTVKTHTLNLYGKLEVNSRVQAVTKAKELNLV